MVPFCSPETVAEVASAAASALAPPGPAVTTYLVSAPLVMSGALQVSVALPSPAAAAPMDGTPGTRPASLPQANRAAAIANTPTARIRKPPEGSVPYTTVVGAARTGCQPDA